MASSSSMPAGEALSHVRSSFHRLVSISEGSRRQCLVERNVSSRDSGKDCITRAQSRLAPSTDLPCRVPWRLAAYLKDVGPATAAAEGIFDVMKAQQKFFESVLQNGNKSSNPMTGGSTRQLHTHQAPDFIHLLNRLYTISTKLYTIIMMDACSPHLYCFPGQKN